MGMVDKLDCKYLFQVVFEDNSQLILKREAIYSQDEDMPKRVKGRLVGKVARSNKQYGHS